MPLVMNATSNEQSLKVHGDWFSFKPGQIKQMHEDKVYYLTTTGSYLGFVRVPDELEDIEARNTPEGKQALADAKTQGVSNRIAYLEQLKHNELVSLQRDIESKNLKYDARLHMSDGMLKNLEELASYKKTSKTHAEARAKQIKDLEKLIEE